MEPGALWVKRDDLTGLAGGGNKARKLEYLCADALAQGADVLVTGGGAQSNHVRMTAAAANRLDLACVVVIAGPRPRLPSGNIVLLALFGAEMVWTGEGGLMDYDVVEAAIDETADRLAAAGRRPYRMPIGGATAVGALGYVQAAAELREQAEAAWGGDPVDVVVVADGSGGTHAGLAAGLGHLGLVLGVDVGARQDLDTQVPAKAAAVAARAGLPAPGGQLRLDQGRIGGGYGEAGDDCRAAVLLAARTEGLVLDPVYTGKAMAGLVAARGDGSIGASSRTVFLHTGGTPALFAAPYASWLWEG